QDQRRGDHAAVRDVVLEVRVAWEVLWKVRREQGLDRPRQAPEVGDLDKQAVPRPQSGGRYEDRDITELQRQRVGKRAARLSAAAPPRRCPAEPTTSALRSASSRATP